MDYDSKTNELTTLIVKTINENKPQSVKDLTAILKGSLNLGEGEIVKIILKLRDDGVIRLEDQGEVSKSFIGYLKEGKANWYWVTVVMAISTAVMVFTISEDFYPWIYLRNAFSLVFILFLPGYAFVKAIFPVNMPIDVASKNLEKIARIALSVGASLAIVPMVGLILYFTPLGLSITPIVLSLLTLIIFLATIAVAREQTKI